jgi:ribosomal protein S6--L-glutamate ligase
MRLVSFDPFRTLGIPGVRHVKPTDWFAAKDIVRDADWVLFPEYWQVGVLTHVWRKSIFPSPGTYHLGHDKVEMTRAFQAVAPPHTPRTLILPNEPWAREAVLDELPLPFVAKERRSSMGAGVRLIASAAEWRTWTDGREELYAQEHLPITRDLRVVYVGDEVVAGYWREAPPGGFLNNVSQRGSVSFDDVPAEALDFVAQTASALGVNCAGFDVAWLDGFPYLLEFNVRFGNRALTERGVDIPRRIHEWLLRWSQPSVDPERPAPARAS